MKSKPEDGWNDKNNFGGGLMENEDKGFYAYVGVKACGCRPMCCIDEPKYQKDTARFVSDAIKHGCTVERVFVPAGESIGVNRCDHEVSK